MDGHREKHRKLAEEDVLISARCSALPGNRLIHGAFVEGV